MTILPLQSDADPAGCAHSCDPGTAIHSVVERTRTKSTRVTKFLKKLAKESIPRFASPEDPPSSDNHGKSVSQSCTCRLFHSRRHETVPHPNGKSWSKPMV